MNKLNIKKNSVPTEKEIQEARLALGMPLDPKYKIKRDNKSVNKK
tara:strand:+ start:385 stop:519 length:135 start_codon:yes stop_codon:yes gene_type:complete